MAGKRISQVCSWPQLTSWTTCRSSRQFRPITPYVGGALASGPNVHVELYTRADCHLCDDALDILRSYNVEPTLVDIDTRPDLLAEYNTCVPVVVIDGKVRFRGRIDRVLLERLLNAKQ